MNPRSNSLILAVVLAGGTAAAQALPLSDRASIALFAGSNVGMSGSFGDVPSNPTPAPTGSIASNGVDFSNAYDHRYTGGAEFAYAFDSGWSAFARAAYSQFDGRSREVGALFGADGRVPIHAQFGDDTSRQFDLGTRYTFAPGARVRPFVGLGLGAADLSASRAMVDNPAGGGRTQVELARGGTVFEQRLETGLQYSPLPNFDLRLTAAASHLGGQKASDDPNLALLGVATTHSAVGERWDYPAELGAVWHF
jgi:hypothetical protein